VIASAVAHLDTGSRSRTGDSKLARYAAVVQAEEAAAPLEEEAKTAMHHAGGVAGMGTSTGGDEGCGVLRGTVPKPWIVCVSRTTGIPLRTWDRPVRRQLWEAAGGLIGEATETSDYC
jgi:hypothetical protein